MNSEVPSGAAGSALPFAPAERYLERTRHRFGALPVRTSALVALSVLGLLLAGRRFVLLSFLFGDQAPRPD